MIDGLICEGLTKEYSGSKGKKDLVDVGFSIPSEGIFSLIGTVLVSISLGFSLLATKKARWREIWSLLLK